MFIIPSFLQREDEFEALIWHSKIIRVLGGTLFPHLEESDIAEETDQQDHEIKG